MAGKVYVNRTLNLKRIKYIGLDMDHTLIRYDTHAFEELSYETIKSKLLAKGYPDEIKKLKFEFDMAIRGLVIDKKRGHLIKLNRHSAIRASYQGTKPVDYKLQRKLYQSIYVDLNDSNYMAIDTAFSLSFACIYSQLVEMKTHGVNLPEFSILADECLGALDEAHRDGSIKDKVRLDLAKYIIKDEKLVASIEKYIHHGKKFFILTNSDYAYTKLLLDYAITPFLKAHSSWTELFEIVITSAQKPRFFVERSKFLKVHPPEGVMTNYFEKLVPGIYQGGDAYTFTADLGLASDEILYIGDHIYGDILQLKKNCGWRTAMVIEELDEEVKANKEAAPLIFEIDKLMGEKEPLEDKLTDLMTKKFEAEASVSDAEITEVQEKITKVDALISSFIRKQNALYNERWGQLMRSGNEESYFAHQVDRFSCIYMTKLGDLLELSPRTYFRSPRRPLSHEINMHP